MNQQSMRKAALFAASETHPSRTQRSRLGTESCSDRGPRSSGGIGSKIIMLSKGTPRGYCSLSACPQVPAPIAESRFFRTIQIYGRPCSRCRWPSSTSQGADLETVWEVY
jgi:hypothetical protein